MKLQGQVAIVTGGATGMGRGISSLLAAEGAKVLVNYRASADAAKEVVAGIESEGARQSPTRPTSSTTTKCRPW